MKSIKCEQLESAEKISGLDLTAPRHFVNL